MDPLVTHEVSYPDLAHWIVDDETDWETSPDAMHWTSEPTRQTSDRHGGAQWLNSSSRPSATPAIGSNT